MERDYKWSLIAEFRGFFFSVC